MDETNVEKLLTPQEGLAIAAFRERVATESGTRLVGFKMFGSRARGEGSPDSDIDILVLISETDDNLKVRIWDIAYRVFNDTDVLISPLVLGRDQYANLVSHERLIAKTIEEEGIPL